MTPTEKVRDMICKVCVCERVCTKEEYQTPCQRYTTAMRMHEWTAKQAEKAFCELCQTKGLQGCNEDGCDNLKLFKSKIE